MSKEIDQAIDVVALAVDVAAKVATRRDNGEAITDQEIIARHPTLHPHLASELKRISSRDMENSSQHSQNDIRLTVLIAPDDQHETSGDFTALPSQGLPSDSEGGQENSRAFSPVQDTIAATQRFRPQFRPPMATLQIFHDIPDVYETYPVRRDRTVIGRARGDVVVPHDPMMSSEHAEIRRSFSDGQWAWELRDLGSTNGTFVGIDEVSLSDGDELVLGSQRYRFICDNDSASLEHFVNGLAVDAMTLSKAGTLIGRDKAGEMSCLADEFLDAKHALFGMTAEGRWGGQKH